MTRHGPVDIIGNERTHPLSDIVTTIGMPLGLTGLAARSTAKYTENVFCR